MTNHDSTKSALSPTLTLLCDRCGAKDEPGTGAFARHKSLDFTPVVRRKERVDGWSAERQRAFIAALAATGSPRRAAAAIGSAPWGADQLRKAEGGESFAAAWDAAMAIAAEERTRRMNEGLGDARRQADWTPPAPWSRAATRRGALRYPPEEPIRTDEDKIEWLASVVDKYLMKLDQERKARLNGEIVAADFYLRQLTHLEVMLDLLGTDGFHVLHHFRQDDRHLVEIAETPFSQILDEARRARWAEENEPPRPAPIPRDLLVDHGRYSTEPTETTRGGHDPSPAEQRRAFEERHKQAAEEQIKWEAEARREYEARSASAAIS